MNWLKLLSRLPIVMLGMALFLATACNKTNTVFKSTTGTTFTDAEQRQLEQEYKERERLYIKGERKGSWLERLFNPRKRDPKRRANKNIDKVIRTARSYRGTPYKYGGTTRLGMDCSGLLCTSFKTINVNLPRSSNEQSRFGRDVRVKDLQPGDLVFFSASKNSRQISHVGMVTDIKGKNEVFFIHSSSTLGVIEDNLYARHYQSIFLKAVRPNI